jgi:hypothetical protein
MKINELFESRDKKKLLSHMRNLFAIACADGSFDDSERDLLSKFIIKAGLTPDEIRRIFEQPESIGFHAPETVKEKYDQLYDMVLVMLINEKIHEKELKLCMIFAAKLGLDIFNIDFIIKDMINAIEGGIASDEAMLKVIEYLEEESLYSNGDGTSLDTAITINASSSIEGIRAEYNYIIEKHGQVNIYWKLELQGSLFQDGRNYDRLNIKLKNGESKSYYFDITQFFGKF